MSKKHDKYGYEKKHEKKHGGIRGVFDYAEEEDIRKMSKKDREKERLRLLKIKDKEVLKQCKCNHIARNNGKHYFKEDPNDPNVVICKICGARVLSPQGWSQVDDDLVNLSVIIIRSIVGLVRNKVNMNSETYDEFTHCLQVVSKMPDFYKELSLDDDDDDEYEEKKHKKDKHGKKHKKDKHGKKDKKKKNKNRDNYGGNCGNYRIEY